MTRWVWGSFVLASFVSGPVSAGAGQLINLKAGETWVTMERDLLIPPKTSEIYFVQDRPTERGVFGRIHSPSHCKVTFRSQEANARRIDGGGKERLLVSAVKLGVNKQREQSTVLTVDGQTISSIECMNTAGGFAPSTMMRASDPTKSDFQLHLGNLFTLSEYSFEDVVKP